MAASEKVLETLENDLKALEKGVELIKLKNGRQYERTYIVDREKMVLRYEGSTNIFRRKIPEVPLFNIQEIREGEHSFTKRFKGVDKECCFGVVVGGRHKLITLLSPSSQIRDMFVRGLRHLIDSEKNAQQEREYDRWIKDAFIAADKNDDGEIDFEECVKLLKRLNAGMKKKYILQLFNEANTNKEANRYGKQTLDNNEFVKFYHLLTKRNELEELFKSYVRGKSFLSPGDLLKFLKQQQKEKNVTEDMCKEWIKRFEPDPCYKQQIKLSLLGFQLFMASDEQSIFNPACAQIYQDMTKPMSYYFINSSHNTYLTEHQLSGPSRVEAYIRALQRGCRCVELDCWDGPEDAPVIYHGHTLTSKIDLDAVIMAIKEYAFKTSRYPVILSIENHCSLSQQKVMAHQFKTILGNLIYVHDDKAPSPSPSDLMNRILLKGKKLHPTATDEEDVSDEDEAGEIEIEKKRADASRHGIEMPKGEAKSKKLKLDKSLSDLIAISSQRFESIEHALNNADQFKMTSIGELKIGDLLEENDLEYCRNLTRAIMVRTYPAGLRTDSSNYNPTPMWNAGCQVDLSTFVNAHAFTIPVALNYQTEDTSMQLLTGKFLDNGGCGYVLKPEYMFPGKLAVRSSPKLLRIKASIPFCKLQVTEVLSIFDVISAYQLPKPKNNVKGEVIDPIVKVEVHGMEDDKEEMKTRVIRNNGFNPRWDETFEFKINHPDLCIVRFTVKDYDLAGDDFIGYYAIPFNCIQEGYRQFNFINKQGEIVYKSLLLLHIDISSLD